jgi:hypothetical protein
MLKVQDGIMRWSQSDSIVEEWRGERRELKKSEGSRHPDILDE